MKKIEHQKDFKLEHEGLTWNIGYAVWVDDRTGRGELRVYRVEGDVTTPLLKEALEALAHCKEVHSFVHRRA